MMNELADLLRDNPASWVDLGVVLTPPTPSLQPGGVVAARHVVVKLVPSSRVVEARVANVGQGAGKGAFIPLQPNDEVIVLFPGGDPHRAVVIGGLGSAKAPNPIENDNLGAVIMHPGGVLLSSATGLPGNGIVHGGILPDLQGFLTAMASFAGAVVAAGSLVGSPAQIAGIVSAAGDLLADPAFVAFTANVTASASSGTAPGLGGPPYSTTFHKVTP